VGQDSSADVISVVRFIDGFALGDFGRCHSVRTIRAIPGPLGIRECQLEDLTVRVTKADPRNRKMNSAMLRGFVVMACRLMFSSTFLEILREGSWSFGKVVAFRRVVERSKEVAHVSHQASTDLAWSDVGSKPRFKQLIGGWLHLSIFSHNGLERLIL
jgi:hypothetical protein